MALTIVLWTVTTLALGVPWSSASTGDTREATIDSTMSEAEFLELADRHIPAPEPEYGIDYEYMLVAGTVEDIRLGRPAYTPRPPETEAFGIATITVDSVFTAPDTAESTPTVMELALVHFPYHDDDGDGVFRGRGDRSEPFDRLHVGDYIIAVAVKTNDPTRQRVWFAGGPRYTSVFSVVRPDRTTDVFMAIITGSTNLDGGLGRRGTPWTLVEPLSFERTFTEVPLQAVEAFSRLSTILRDRQR